LGAGFEADRCAAGRGEVEGIGAGGGEMEAERKKSSGRSCHGEAAAAVEKGFVVSPGSAIGEWGRSWRLGGVNVNVVYYSFGLGSWWGAGRQLTRHAEQIV
jgi:hypothetical protein